ncbi:MAG: hypothetical protein V4757_07455 [Pseudomonadota bacterium]
MGQITQATIDMIEKHAIKGEMPPLTAWEVLQLAHAWKATRVSVEDPWQTLFWEVARAVNCLPSIFPEGNAHVLKKVRTLSAAPTPPQPAAQPGTLWANRRSIVRALELGDERPYLYPGLQAVDDVEFLVHGAVQPVGEEAPTTPEKLCIFCTHFNWSEESCWGHGSTMTGPMMEGGDATCAAGQYSGRWDNRPTNETEYRDIILRAEGCSEYLPVTAARAAQPATQKEMP